jgi:stringent starvation protein B
MPDLPRPLPPKKDVALALLEGPSIFVHLDPRRPGVVVPKWFLGQPQLVLQVGLNMPIPIPDLKVDDDGVSCTLSFSRSPFWCCIPWSAIYALVGEDGRGMVWPTEVPPELASQMQQKAGSPQAKPAKRQRAKLAAVEPNEGEAAKTEGARGEGARSEGPRGGAKGRLRHEPRPEHGEHDAEPPARAKPGEARPGERESAPPRHTDRSSRPVEARPAAAAEGKRETGAGQGRPSQAGAAGQKKPKRELPPYLRVIK